MPAFQKRNINLIWPAISVSTEIFFDPRLYLSERFLGSHRFAHGRIHATACKLSALPCALRAMGAQKPFLGSLLPSLCCASNASQIPFLESLLPFVCAASDGSPKTCPVFRIPSACACIRARAGRLAARLRARRQGLQKHFRHPSRCVNASPFHELRPRRKMLRKSFSRLRACFSVSPSVITPVQPSISIRAIRSADIDCSL